MRGKLACAEYRKLTKASVLAETIDKGLQTSGRDEKLGMACRSFPAQV